MAATTRRIPALDGLRGVAVVVVVLYHAGHLRGGFLGVDLFFVLSGFLITSILRRSWAADRNIDLRHFWARRARRLLPALVVMVAVVVPVWSIWFATSTDLTVVRRDALATLAYVSNWEQIFAGRSYWEGTLAVSPLKHTWSLAVEEQFYVVWPLLALVLLRRGGASAVRKATPALAVVLALGTSYAAFTGMFSLNALYLSTPTRAAAIFAGASLAAWYRPRRTDADPRLDVAALVAFCGLAWMWTSVQVFDEGLYRYGFIVSAIFGTVLVAAAASPVPGRFTSLFTFAPLRWLGTLSYGIYLWSWPIMQMVSERHTSLRGYTLLAVQLALTLVAACISWYGIERRVLAGVWPWPSGARLLAGAFAITLALVLVATSGAQPIRSSAPSMGDYTNPDSALPRIMVVGDSVPAGIVEDGMGPLSLALGIAVVDRTAPGCLVLGAEEVRGTEGNIRSEVGPCNRGWADQVAELQPDVVMVMFGQLARDEVRIDGSFQKPCMPGYQAAVKAELEAGIDELSSSGAQVVFVTAPGTSVGWVLEDSPGLNEAMGCLNDLYRELASERDYVHVVEFAPYVCPEGEPCRESIDGVNLREDTVHFHGDSAKLVARYLAPLVVAASQ